MRGSWTDVLLRPMARGGWFPPDYAVDSEVDAHDEIGREGGEIALEYAHVLRWQASLTVSLSLSSPLPGMCTADVVPHR